MSEQSFDVIVIGAGVAGLAAARHSIQRGFATACVEAQMFGGLVLNVGELDPAPRGRQGSGADLASALMSEILEAGVVSVPDVATTVHSANGAFSMTTPAQDLTAQAVILAMGARLKTLGIPGEAQFEHRGVAHCADCDAAFYAGRDVVVVGGGDSALQEALVLSRHCHNVFIVHRRGRFRARPAFVEAVAGRQNIRPLFDRRLREIRGNAQVEAIVAENVRTGATEEIPCTGVFPYVGLEANAACAPIEVERDERGFLRTDDQLSTAVPRLLAVGAVRSGFGGELDDAFADGERAVAALARSLAPISAKELS